MNSEDDNTLTQIIPNFELTNHQVSELFLYFNEYVVTRNLDFLTVSEYFAPGTNSFVDFVISLEKHFKWFDYSQAEDVIDVLDIYLQTIEREAE